MSKKIWFIGALALSAGLFAAEKNILETSKWRLYTSGGTAGQAQKNSDGTYTLSRTGEQGAYWFYNAANEYPVTPGKTYRFSIEYDSASPCSIMVQVMGGKRTPYPSAVGKNGIAEVTLTTRPQENKARIHFGMRKAGTAVIKRIVVDEIEHNDNLLQHPEITWKPVRIGKAKGSVVRQGNDFLMTRDNNEGAMFFYNGGSEFPVTPGKAYRFGVEYESTVDGALMVQVMGAKRTPYPQAKGKNGVVEVSFVTLAQENKARIHFSIPQGKALIKRIYVEEADPGENLFANPAVSWRVSDVNGAKSSMRQSGGKYVVTKSDARGFSAFVPVADLDIAPGKNYQVDISVLRRSQEVSYSLMFQMPGGKRTPFPGVSSNGTVNETEKMTFVFTARPDEKKLRPHVIIRGQGTVEIQLVAVKEISEAEMKASREKGKVKAVNFKGGDLKKVWRSFGVAKSGDKNSPFVEFTVAPRGGVACENLDWNAADIKGLEVDFKVAEEGGYLECAFTSSDNGRKYSSTCGVSVVPDGEFHRILFPVGENPAWRGKITSMQIRWIGQSAPAGFREINATAKLNRIYDMRPRGEYTLSRLTGNAAAELRFLDRYYQEIGKVTLPAGKREVKFTVPELCMTVEKVPADAPLHAELELLPKLDRPAAYWRGKWIWCWNGFGPDATNVWFQRKFVLDDNPQEAELVIAGDDAFTAYVNGNAVGSGANWTLPGKFDVAKYLKKGENTVVMKVYNSEAWGGFLGELYVSVNGKTQYIVSDKNWMCHVGGGSEPAVFERQSMEIGAPPVAPWNTRVGYQYVGPKGKIRVISSGEQEFTAEVLEDFPVKSRKLDLLTVDRSGSKRNVTGVITPDTSLWKKGSRVNVKISMGKQFRAAEIFNASDFMVVENQAKLGDVKISKHIIPPVSSAKVTGNGSRPYFQINGKNYAPIYYLLSGGFSKWPDSRDWMIRNAVDSGCKIMRHGASFQNFWIGEDKFDFSSVDRCLDTVANYAPGTKIIISVNTGMPRWWLAKNPGDMTAYFGGKTPQRDKDLQALASKNWLKDARIGLRALIRHLQNSPYADMIIGIGLSEGWNSEWFWSYADDKNKFAMSGYSPADHATFRTYLKERYRSDEVLQKAWNRKDVTLENAPMPTDKQWYGGSVGVFLDPQKDMQVIDWFRFRNRSIGEAITTLARYVKEESNGKWLAGAYYGYLLAFSNIYHRLQTVGHLDIERVARSPYVDFLTAPSYYTWRHAGQGDAIMQAAESFTAHGKMIIVEQDLRTFGETSNYEIKNGMLSTPEQSVGGLDRAIALTMTRGVGTHWLEMYENWFREPLLINVMKEGIEAYEALGEVKGTTPVEFALVSDPESAMYVKINMGDGVHVASIGEMQRRLTETAMPYRHVLLKDMLEKNVVPEHKFYIVNNLFMLDDAERSALMERFKKEKAVVLWLYAAGVSTPEQGPSVEKMSEFLGIKFRMDTGNDRPAINLVPGYSVKRAVNFNLTSPWFYPVSGFDEVIGRTANGNPALVKWQKDGVTHYFSTLMNLPPALIRDLAERAGVHCYSKSGDPVLAGNDVVALHAKNSGKKVINLRPGCTMKAILGPVKGVFRSGQPFDVRAGQTYVFKVDKE